MTLAPETKAPLRHADRFFIGGEWVKPSSDAMIDVIDSGTEQLFFSVAEARESDMARAVAGQLRSGTVGHNAFRTDFGMAFGGFRQSGIGREGGREGLLPFLETKTVILEGTPAGYAEPAN